MAPKNAPARPELPTTRSAAEQVEALLRLTDRQVANIERAAVLTGAELAQLSQLAGILACLVNAQKTASRQDDPSKMTDEELLAAASR